MKGQCDTPGFPLQKEASIKTDHRHAQRLYMPRNHNRINQTSRHMLQSWRANCDVQLIIYDSDPLKPDIAEIARITDYIVSYSTKGNVTWKEENEQTKQLIMASDDVYGGIEDLRRVAKQVMNKSATKRLISKQEAMVLLSGLPLTMCTETVESVSINNSREIKKTPNAEATDKRFVSVYGRRKICLDMSLSEYFCCVKNHPRRLADGGKYIIPNFVGISGAACYPVSEAYARHTIVVYKPWTEYPTNRNWIAEFNWVPPGEEHIPALISY